MQCDPREATLRTPEAADQGFSENIRRRHQTVPST